MGETFEYFDSNDLRFRVHHLAMNEDPLTISSSPSMQ